MFISHGIFIMTVWRYAHIANLTPPANITSMQLKQPNMYVFWYYDSMSVSTEEFVPEKHRIYVHEN